MKTLAIVAAVLALAAIGAAQAFVGVGVGVTKIPVNTTAPPAAPGDSSPTYYILGF